MDEFKGNYSDSFVKDSELNESISLSRHYSLRSR